MRIERKKEAQDMVIASDTKQWVKDANGDLVKWIDDGKACITMDLQMFLPDGRVKLRLWDNGTPDYAPCAVRDLNYKDYTSFERFERGVRIEADSLEGLYFRNKRNADRMLQLANAARTEEELRKALRDDLLTDFESRFLS